MPASGLAGQWTRRPPDRQASGWLDAGPRPGAEDREQRAEGRGRGSDQGQRPAAGGCGQTQRPAPRRRNPAARRPTPAVMRPRLADKPAAGPGLGSPGPLARQRSLPPAHRRPAAAIAITAQVCSAAEHAPHRRARAAPQSTSRTEAIRPAARPLPPAPLGPSAPVPSRLHPAPRPLPQPRPQPPAPPSLLHPSPPPSPSSIAGS